jgi:hypothetical protein
MPTGRLRFIDTQTSVARHGWMASIAGINVFDLAIMNC